MTNPKDLQYTRTHEWVKFSDDGTALIGITDYAQDQLGDLVFVNLPLAGDPVTAGETFADVESVKAVSDVVSPVTGEVEEVNETLADEPILDLVGHTIPSPPQNSAYSGLRCLMHTFVTTITISPNSDWNRPAAVPRPMLRGWVVVMRYT